MKLAVKFLFVVLLFPISLFAQSGSGSLLPWITPTFLIGNGTAPLANGFVCTYAAGTTTPKFTYLDGSLTTDNQNPIRLNSAGQPVNGSSNVSIYLGSGVDGNGALFYKFSLYQPGTGNFCNGFKVGALVRTVDNIYDIGQLIAEGLINIVNKNINNIRYCNAFTGLDAGVKISACIADLPSTGGTADARGLEGAQSAASLISIAKSNVTVLLPPDGITCTAGCFSISASGVQLYGNSLQGTYLVTTSDTADIIVTSSTATVINDLGFRCSSGSRTSGAAVHIADGGNGFSNRLFIEPCYNGVQMDQRTSWNWGPMTLASSGSTPGGAVWNCLICLIGGTGNNVITDTTFVHPILAYDRPALAGALLVDRGTDSITFFNPEVVAGGSCRATAISCGPSILITNSNYPSAVSPRTIRFFGAIAESTEQDIGIDVQTCKDCLFDGSNVDNALIGLRVNELHTAALNGNFRFVNGRIIQTVRQCVTITGAGGAWIQGNRLGGCSGLASSSYPAIEAMTDAVNFHVDNNDFHPSFSYSFQPTYFLKVDAGGGDQWSFVGNQMLNADRLTANYIDSSTGLNKIIGPNNEESHTEFQILSSLKSTIVGVAPVIVATTLPATNLNAFPVTYNATTGSQVANAFAQIGVGTASGAGTATITLATSYSVAGSYICMVANDNATYAAAVTSYVSGTQFALAVGRANADGFHYMCLGN